jgi:hypothetical protein
MVKEKEALETGIQAYIYAYPLVMMGQTPRQARVPARRLWPCYLISLKRSLAVTFNAFAILTMFKRLTFLSPRSIPPMYVQCSPALSARAS